MPTVAAPPGVKEDKALQKRITNARKFFLRALRFQIGRFVAKFVPNIADPADMNQFIKKYESRWKKLQEAGDLVLAKLEPFRARSEQEHSAGDNEELFKAYVDFTTTMGSIINDLMELYRQEGYLREEKDTGFYEFSTFVYGGMDNLGKTVKGIREYRER
jgi:hypothetical protein